MNEIAKVPVNGRYENYTSRRIIIADQTRNSSLLLEPTLALI
jgi:hypothetical protein